MSHSLDFWLLAATCLVFFLLGAFTAPEPLFVEEGLAGGSVSGKVSGSGSRDDVRAHPETSGDLVGASRQSFPSSSSSRHSKAQKEFQTKIRGLQYTSTCHDTRRLLVRASPAVVGVSLGEQFAREFHYLSLSLQVAVATGRMLVLDDQWQFLAKFQTQCAPITTSLDPRLSAMELRSVVCLRPSWISNCTQFGPSESKSSQRFVHPSSVETWDNGLSFGIIPDVDITIDNGLFHADYYGPRQVMEMPAWQFPKSTFLIDVVPFWERSMGRFWVRSQMVHFLWEHWHRHEMIPSSTLSSSWMVPPTPATPHGDPYISFYWISCEQLRKNLATKFGRDASVTQSLERYMQVANFIRQRLAGTDSSPRTIYFITDGVHEVLPPEERFEEKYPDWDFVPLLVPQHPATTNLGEEERILASLEVMRKADYLVGSFQSQMFRLAAELNSAWFAARYAPSVQRHFTLDVEWFENP